MSDQPPPARDFDAEWAAMMAARNQPILGAGAARMAGDMRDEIRQLRTEIAGRDEELAHARHCLVLFADKVERLEAEAAGPTVRASDIDELMREAT